MSLRAYLASLAAVLVVTGCADDRPYADAVIRAEALEGCRAPADEGCMACCKGVALFGSACTPMGGDPSCGAETPSEFYGLIGTCEHYPDMPDCASCTTADEARLRALVQPDSCDCATVDMSGDYCAAESNLSSDPIRPCACFCWHEQGDLNHCPVEP